MTGQITVVRKPCGTDLVLDRVAEYLESCPAYLPDTFNERGFSVSEDEPGPSNINLPWLRTTDEGQVWMHWSVKLGQFVPIGGIIGERHTRRRVADTVAEELAGDFASWQLADGTNLLGIDLRETKPIGSVYRLDFPPEAPPEEVTP